MPEKKLGVIGLIRGVFRGKKTSCEDIVCQAEAVIANYIVRRRNEIIHRHSRKKHRFLNFLIVASSGVLLYLVCRLAF